MTESRLDIAYNTESEDIRYPEYGRSIQEMLQYAVTIPERAHRQQTTEAIIAMMQIVNPGNIKNTEEYRERLWNHALAITNYELDVTPPANVVIRRTDERPRPSPIGYPATATRFRHYGNSIQNLIEKAAAMPEGPKKEGFVEVIASYMKLAYKTWNKEHYVSDIIVKDDLEILSGGRLELHEGHSSLDVLAAGASRMDRSRKRSGSNGGGSSNNGGGKNRGGRNRGGSNSGGSGRKQQQQGFKKRRK
jgi:uncharacterized membrane protein YgcG